VELNIKAVGWPRAMMETESTYTWRATNIHLSAYQVITRG